MRFGTGVALLLVLALFGSARAWEMSFNKTIAGGTQIRGQFQQQFHSTIAVTPTKGLVGYLCVANYIAIPDLTMENVAKQGTAFCPYFFQFKNGSVAVPPAIPAIYASYQFALYIDTTFKVANPAISFKGDACSDGEHCPPPGPLLNPGNNTIALGVNGTSSTAAYTMFVPSNTAYFTLTPSCSGTCPASLKVKYCSECDLDLSSDYNGSVNVTQSLPMGSTYYLEFTSTSKITFTLNVLFKTCGRTMTGPNCEYPLQWIEKGLTKPFLLNFTKDAVKYFAVPWGANDALNALTAASHSDEVKNIVGNNTISSYPNPSLAASLNRFPTDGQALINGCNQNHCYFTNRIVTTGYDSGAKNRTASTKVPNVWIIAVKNPGVPNVTNPVTWVGGDCDPRCAIRGTCTAGDTPNTGLCKCIALDYSGLGCQNVKIVLGAPWIALLAVVGVTIFLVVLVLILYCALRAKKHSYEPIA